MSTPASITPYRPPPLATLQQALPGLVSVASQKMPLLVLGGLAFCGGALLFVAGFLCALWLQSSASPNVPLHPPAPLKGTLPAGPSGSAVSPPQGFAFLSSPPGPSPASSGSSQGASLPKDLPQAAAPLSTQGPSQRGPGFVYKIQMGVFVARDNAIEWAAKLLGQNVPARIEVKKAPPDVSSKSSQKPDQKSPPKPPQKPPLFQVLAEQTFATYEAAAAFANTLFQEKGISTLVFSVPLPPQKPPKDPA